ncbi:MAG TPA: AAA family ATPase [Solirubrobacteraceae bacterium]|jgi:cell division protease FtsH|nr:AAA family ATPase [Solirubrobacteraceae bacterium]
MPSFTAVTNFLHSWGPIAMMALICMLLVYTMRAMPKRQFKEHKTKGTKSKIRWDEVAGIDHEKDELEEVVEFLRNPAKFHALGARVPRGVLLYGPPGTGKTLLAKAVAGEANAKFYSTSAAEFAEVFVGLGAARIRKLFAQARKNAPAIIFIDELDAAGRTRGRDVSGERDGTLNALLVEMDGFAACDNVVVIAASNMIEQLDPALMRAGRLDRQIYVGTPDKEGRRAILDVHTRGKRLARRVDLDHVVGATAGMSGAQLANLTNEAAIFAAREDATEIEQHHFDAAMERVIAGVASKRIITDHERRVVAHHEAGHALISELLPRLSRVHKVSLVPRGQALGYALNLPDEDRYLKTRSELEDWLVMLLGGRASEQLIFGEPTNGAADDLNKAYELSRGMVTHFGFADGIGVQRLPAEDYSMSEHTRRLIDEAQQAITEAAWQRALDLVAEHELVLRALAERLLAEETLERDDIVTICAPARRALAAAA